MSRVRQIVFFAPGRPVTQGSKVPIAYKEKGTGRLRATLREDRSRLFVLASWRSVVAARALEAVRYFGVSFAAKEPVELWLEFLLSRPRTLARKHRHPAVRPDLDKLERAIKDAMRGVAYVDDGQVCEVHKRKRYRRPEELSEGVIILARDMPEEGTGGQTFQWQRLQEGLERARAHVGPAGPGPHPQDPPPRDRGEPTSPREAPSEDTHLAQGRARDF
jgi:crossover junction endodeoxyribonuclease RusA